MDVIIFITLVRCDLLNIVIMGDDNVSKTTKDSDEGLKEEFKKREIKQYMTLILICFVYPIVIFITAVMEKSFDEIPKIIVIGIIAVIIAPVGYSYINWRCPRCGMFLGKGLFPKYCRMCGFKLK